MKSKKTSKKCLKKRARQKKSRNQHKNGDPIQNKLEGEKTH